MNFGLFSAACCLRRSHIAQARQVAIDGLPSIGRHLLPSWQEAVLEVLTLLGRHLFEDVLTSEHGFAFRGDRLFHFWRLLRICC